VPRRYGSKTINREPWQHLIPLYVDNPFMGLRAFHRLICDFCRARNIKSPGRSTLCDEIRNYKLSKQLKSKT
jgi:hypothetical protein